MEKGIRTSFYEPPQQTITEINTDVIVCQSGVTDDYVNNVNPDWFE